MTDQPEKKAPQAYWMRQLSIGGPWEVIEKPYGDERNRALNVYPAWKEVIEVTDSDSVSVPREKNVQILIDALENAKTDLRDLDTVCMADYKLVISGFSRAVLSIQIALSDFRKAQALSRGGE